MYTNTDIVRKERIELVVSNTENEVAIVMYLIVALGAKDYLHEHIDAIYAKDKMEYYKYYRESKYYNCRLFNMYTTKTLEYIKKVAGIVECEYKNQSNENILALIKKGYKAAYNSMKDRKVIDVEKYIDMYIKKNGGRDKVVEMDLISNIIIIIYYCSVYDVECILGVYEETMTLFFQETEVACYCEEINFSDKEMEEYGNQIEEFYKRYNLKRIDMYLDNICGYIGFQEIMQLPQAKNHDIGFHELRDLAFKQGVTKYIGAYSGYLKFLGINEMDLSSSVLFKKNDLDKLFMEFIVAKRENGISDKDKDIFVVSCLFINALAREYKKTKDKYLSDIQSEFYYEIKKLEEVINAKEKDINSKKAEMEQEKIKTAQEKDKLLEEINHLKKSNTLLEKEVEDNKYNKKELRSLREYVFNQSKETEVEVIEEVDPFQERIDYLKTKKCAVLGGSPTWINKVKDILPNFLYLDTDNLNREIKFIDNMEAVFVNTSVMSHSFYGKIMNRMVKNNVPLFYINSNMNLKLAVNHIYENIEMISMK